MKIKIIFITLLFVSVMSCGNIGTWYAKYSVDGNEIADISYLDNQGVVQNLDGEQLPWSIEMPVDTDSIFLYLKVENSNGDNSRIDLSIYFDGSDKSANFIIGDGIIDVSCDVIRFPDVY